MARPPKPPRIEANESGYWEIRWTEGGRSRRLSTQTRDHAVAQEAFGLWLLGERKKDVPGAIRCEQAWALYWEEHVEPKVVAKERLDYCWKRLEPEFGRRQLNQLGTPDFLAYDKKRRKDGASPSTVRKELTALQAAFNHLITTKRINPMDAPFIPMPDPAPPKERWLTQSELEHLLATAEKRRKSGPSPDRLSRVERFVHIAARTGARKRSIEQLTWAQVDFEKKLIDFNPPGRRQSSKRRPTVPIAEALLPILEQAHKERSSNLWVLDRGGAVRKGFDALCTAAGFPDVTPHTLRHTWATHAVMAGVSLVDVARVLGNSVQMVMKVYAKYAPEYLRDAVDFSPHRAAA